MTSAQPGSTSVFVKQSIRMSKPSKIPCSLPFAAVQRLAVLTGITVEQVAEIIAVPRRTLTRRRLSGRLTADESERLLRLSRVTQKAVNLFDGDVAAAVSWLRSPASALGNRIPLENIRREPGARAVETLIGRIEDGIFS
jgi:putative toxin-antitoxin system antitoxin component (TIGR02293 family)